jgi:hypothetical protein
VDVLGREAEGQRCALRTKQAEADQALSDITASMQVRGVACACRGAGVQGCSAGCPCCLLLEDNLLSNRLAPARAALPLLLCAQAASC